MEYKRSIITALLLTAATTLSAQAPSGIQGVWRVTAASPLRSGGIQPSVVIFTARHFSITRLRAERPSLDGVENPTPEQMVSLWGPLQAQAGTYEVANGQLTTRAVVSKNPAAMRAGSSITYDVKIDRQTLTLIQRTVPGDTPQPAETLTLSRIE